MERQKESQQPNAFERLFVIGWQEHGSQMYPSSECNAQFWKRQPVDNRCRKRSSLLVALASAKIRNMTTVAISLSDADQRFIEEALKSGRYMSESEIVAEALADFRVREAIRSATDDELRAKIRVGIEQADRGDFVEFTADDVIRERRESLAQRQKSAS